MKPDIWQRLRNLMERERIRSLEFAFALGDWMVDALLVTGLRTEADLIRRIERTEGENALPQQRYSQAHRLAVTFNAAQRAVLIAKAVSVEAVDWLAGERFTPQQRVEAVSQIKSGKLRAPWSAFLERTGRRKPRIAHGVQKATTESDIIAVQIRRNGEYSPDDAFDGLRALVSQVIPQERLVDLLNQAVRDRRKAGMPLKEFRI